MNIKLIDRDQLPKLSDSLKEMVMICKFHLYEIDLDDLKYIIKTEHDYYGLDNTGFAFLKIDKIDKFDLSQRVNFNGLPEHSLDLNPFISK